MMNWELENLAAFTLRDMRKQGQNAFSILTLGFPDFTTSILLVNQNREAHKDLTETIESGPLCITDLF